MPLEGLWCPWALTSLRCPWRACGASARPLVPLGPDRTVVSLTNLKCLRQARGAPDRPVVPVLGLWCPCQACGAPDCRWCPWQACGAPGAPRGGGVMTHVTPPPLDPPLSLIVLICAAGGVYFEELDSR